LINLPAKNKRRRTEFPKYKTLKILSAEYKLIECFDVINKYYFYNKQTFNELKKIELKQIRYVKNLEDYYIDIKFHPDKEEYLATFFNESQNAVKKNISTFLIQYLKDNNKKLESLTNAELSTILMILY
jgi:hypothetical protein